MTTEVEESKVQSSAAYVLFYRRRGSHDFAMGANGSAGAAAMASSSDYPGGGGGGGAPASGYDEGGRGRGVATGEAAGVVANMSARPRENTGNNGRGGSSRVGASEFGGMADLDMLGDDGMPDDGGGGGIDDLQAASAYDTATDARMQLDAASE
jgi:hypothetical protein